MDEHEAVTKIRRLGEEKHRCLLRLHEATAGTNRLPGAYDGLLTLQRRANALEAERGTLIREAIDLQDFHQRQDAYCEQLIRETLLMRRLARERLGLDPVEPVVVPAMPRAVDRDPKRFRWGYWTRLAIALGFLLVLLQPGLFS